MSRQQIDSFVKRHDQPGKGQSHINPREIDIDSVPYYPLPPSPYSWDLKRSEPPGAKTELFESETNSQLNLVDVTGLEIRDRPDPAYQKFTPVAHGCVFIDPKGKAVAHQGSKASLLLRDHDGLIACSKGIDHDIYRIGTNPTGTHSAFLSSNAVIHVYGENLDKVFEVDLSHDRRAIMFRESSLGSFGPLRTQVRSVATSPHGSRYLWTIADTAWCIDGHNSTIWAVSMPLKDGWERSYSRSNIVGERSDVRDALELMGLSLPVAHEAIRSNYRNLAKKWHPDLNPSDADSTRKMQALNRAFSILTGIDPLSLQLQAREVVDYRRTKPDLVIDSGLIKLEISFGDSPPLDWIYTSSFAADREHIFVGSYAGKIVKLDALGVPIAAIDVASVPRSIFDIGQYLYILTDTRMYVVGRNYELVNLIDIHQRGKLITAPQGFGLMANKSLQWYSLSGEESTEIRTKHPIRAAYYTGSGIIVETRQHRARFAFV